MRLLLALIGPTKEINDPIRGKGSFDKCLKNIKRAKELGYNIDITACISKEMIKRDDKGNLYLDRMIKFAEELGIENGYMQDFSEEDEEQYVEIILQEI